MEKDELERQWRNAKMTLMRKIAAIAADKPAEKTTKFDEWRIALETLYDVAFDLFNLNEYEVDNHVNALNRHE